MTSVLATYRLQFHDGFTFADARRAVDYFAALGVSHLYASPITTSQPGSTHGYDTVDYTRVNPALGGEAGLRALVADLRARGMGLIVDIVPNHMGVGGADNAWWLDILEWGRHAEHARYFDVDWHSPDPALRGKVLAPFLGEPFGEALAANKITLAFDPRDGRFFAAYYAHRFPICPCDYARILDPQTIGRYSTLLALAERFDAVGMQPADQARARAARQALADYAAQDEGRAGIDTALAAFNADTVTARERLQRLLDRQHYRLAWWRSAADEVNWRRFFDISALAGVRVERGEVFDASHALILRLYAEGLIDGVRVDHVDGLAEPREYCQRLRARLDTVHPQRPAPLRAVAPYLVIEKILARGETMRTNWQIDGTTGYDFMNDVGALLHDPAGADPLAALWSATSGRSPVFADEALPARRKVLAENLAAELDRATRALHRIARESLTTRDYSFTAIRRVLTELVVHYPVYRIYPVDLKRTAEDEKYFALAREGARATLRRADHGLLEQVDVWLGGAPVHAASAGASDAASGAASAADAGANIPKPTGRELSRDALRDPRVAQRRIALTLFSQLTSPVAAKSVEDTACYRYGRLLSRNEVGADPDDFALSVDAFHAINDARRANFPHAMLTTATHDHKRGEDVRARLAVLSELPTQWAALSHRWAALNRPWSQTFADGTVAPSAGFEFMLYQTLLGCWPADLAANDRRGIDTLAERVAAWQEKALREAKLETDWFAPNEAYEAACRRFLFDILSPQQSGGFVASLHDAVTALAPAGIINSLQQTLLRLTAPGVPDLYQGTELWDLSLVDPDNRRPVDYPLRSQLLTSETDDLATASAMLEHWHDGRIKQYVIRHALHLRRDAPDLFLKGAYVPIEVVGAQARSVIAFARRYGDEWLLVVATRLAATLLDTDIAALPAATPHLPLVAATRWEDTRLLLPAALAGAPLHDHLSGQAHRVPAAEGASTTTYGLSVAVLLNHLPLAMLSTLTR